jgi:hypothetical protein
LPVARHDKNPILSSANRSLFVAPSLVGRGPNSSPAGMEPDKAAFVMQIRAWRIV